MSIKKKLKFFLTGQRWSIGFITESITDIINNKPLHVRYLKGIPKDRWFADPFILSHDNDKIYLLVEEYLYKTRLGRIAKLTISKKDYTLLSSEVVMKLDSHLSFPAILRKDNNVYIYPENAKGLGLALYKYSLDNNSCSYIKTISGEPLADAIITSLFGEDLMFSTQIPTHNGSRLSVHVFCNHKPLLIKEIDFPSCVARNAGDWFKVGDSIFRPAQDCNGGYGKAVLLQKVRRENETFSFLDVRRITSTNKEYTTGCHTFNYYDNLSVIDVHGYCYPIAAKIYSILQRLRKIL